MNKNPVERTYPGDNRVSQETIMHHIKRYEFASTLRIAERRVLDLACGHGYGTEILRKAGYDKAIGIDIDEQLINENTKKYPQCRFLKMDITRTAYLPNADLITFFEAIEHLTFHQGKTLLWKIFYALNYNGLFVLSTPRDINDKYNRLHKSEWPYFLIKNELGGIFSDVRLYGQDWKTGIINEDNVRDNDFYIAVCKK